MCRECDRGIMVKDGKCDSGEKCGINHCEFCSVSKMHNKETCTLCSEGYSILIDGTKHTCKKSGVEHC